MKKLLYRSFVVLLFLTAISAFGTMVTLGWGFGWSGTELFPVFITFAGFAVTLCFLSTLCLLWE